MIRVDGASDDEAAAIAAALALAFSAAAAPSEQRPAVSRWKVANRYPELDIDSLRHIQDKLRVY